MSKSPRIVLFDIETIPNLGEVLKVYPSLGDYPGLTLKASITSVICFGWKVLGSKRTNIINAWDFDSWKRSINDDKALVKACYDVIKGADVVVTHNGKRFDWKFLQTRLIHHKLPPLPPIIHIDTCSESKKHLYAFNNRLKTLAKFLTTEEKKDNGGWDLWVDVYARKPAAMKKMSAYCKQDVVALEAIFERLRPLIKGIPNHNQYTKEQVCPPCGSLNLQRRGFSVSKEATIQRYQCQDCGAWSRLKKSGVGV